MKLGIISAVWGRESLTQIWWKATQRVTASFQAAGVTSQVFVAGSERSHQRLCNEASGVWVPAANDRVGAKWNAVARQAIAWGADYLLILGSDDFLSPALVQRYCALLPYRPHYAGIRQIYMVEPRTQRFMLADIEQQTTLRPITMAEAKGKCTVVILEDGLAGERKYVLHVWSEKSCIGAGRLVSTALFAGVDEPWDAERNRALDASLDRNLQLPPPQIIPTDTDAFAVDVKTTQNIWSLDSLMEWFPNGAVPDKTFFAALPEWPALEHFAG